MTVEEWFSTSHLGTTWALLSLTNTPLTGLYILVQGSQSAFENPDPVQCCKAAYQGRSSLLFSSTTRKTTQKTVSKILDR